MKEKKVIEIGTTEVKTIPAKSTVMNALKTMNKEKFRRMPVADAGTKRLLGILSATDLINYLGGGEKFKLIENKYQGNLARAINESIEEIMTRDVITLSPEDSWKEAVKKMFNNNVSGCPIVDKENRVVGIITERDILKFLAAYKKPQGFVRDYMAKDVITISPKTSVREAMEIMIKYQIRRLPVVDGKKLVGVIVSTDFIRYFAGEAFQFLQTGNIEDALSQSVEKMVKNSSIAKYLEPPTCEIHEKLSDILDRMLENRAGFCLVMEDEELKGVITEKDLVKFLYENN